jgi:hypothetical protein
MTVSWALRENSWKLSCRKDTESGQAGTCGGPKLAMSQTFVIGSHLLSKLAGA